MRRITINVDLNENEILQEEVVEALKGYARRVARETLMASIDAEAKRVVSAALTNEYSGLRRELTEQIRAEVRKEISIGGFDQRFVTREIRGRIDEAAKQALQELTKNAKDYLMEAVGEKAKQITRTEYVRMVAEALLSNVKERPDE